MRIDLPQDRTTQHFVLGILAAFLPAVIVGLVAHDFIKVVLFKTPVLICTMLILGGFVLLAIDRMTIKPRFMTSPITAFAQTEDRPVQCLAMVPGVSRSGATIAGSLLMETDSARWPIFLLPRRADHGGRFRLRSL